MKKQILILILFVAAIVAGTSNSYGQLPTVPTYDNALSVSLDSCLSPTILSCWDSVSALHPAPGVEYTYSITSDDYAGSGSETVHWFVIENSDLGTINPSADISTLSTNGVIDPADGSEYLLTASGSYDVPTQTSDSVTLSWNYFDGTTNIVLLVAYVEDAVNCTNNMEVYRIMPEFNFTLDIAAIDQDDNTFYRDTAAPAEECVSPIESAYYTPGADVGDGTLTVDYGENYVYFIVNAANFVGGWQPTFSFDYDGTGGQAVITDAAWTYYGSETSTTASDWNPITVSSGASSAPVIAGGASASINDLNSVNAGGECIIVRAHLDYGTDYENVDLTRVTVTVDGIMYDAANDNYTNNALADYGPDTNSDGTCDQVTGDDISYYNITPRPDVNELDPTPFEQKTGEDQ